VLKCGRRFGKTELAKELLLMPMLEGYPVAYFAPTYKDLELFWIEFKWLVLDLIKEKYEATKRIHLVTGGSVDMWSLDEPDSGRGRKYKLAVVDEAEKVKKLKEAWQGSVRPTLTDYRGGCWFLSTPKFGDTYFKELYKQAAKQDDWQCWRYSTYDNPHISREELESAKNSCVPEYFRCEYLAEDIKLTDSVWAYAFDESRHIGEPELVPGEVVYLSFDFNKNPICCSVIQYINETINVLEVIKLNNSDIYALCDYINAYYGGNLFIVTGDATGKAGSALVRGNVNYYTVIMQQLKLGRNQLVVPTVNPPIAENQVLINSILARGKVCVHREKGKWLIFDFLNVKVSADGRIEKGDRSDPTKQADALDTFNYYCNTFHKNFIYRVQT
jgi:hypothetical protein